MIVRGENLEQKVIESPRGGKGKAVAMAYEAANGLAGEIGAMAMMQLEPGSEIGYHEHTDDMELYLILDGIGRVNDNGTMEIVNPGDLVVTKQGESHSLINETPEPVTFLAIIIK